MWAVPETPFFHDHGSARSVQEPPIFYFAAAHRYHFKSRVQRRVMTPHERVSWTDMHGSNRLVKTALCTVLCIRTITRPTQKIVTSPFQYSTGKPKSLCNPKEDEVSSHPVVHDCHCNATECMLGMNLVKLGTIEAWTLSAWHVTATALPAFPGIHGT